MLSFRQVEVFRSVIAVGTTTGASESLSISQPAVSRQIAALEDHLGFKLFERVKGRLEPTSEGIRFARIVEQNFLGLERIERAAKDIRDETPQPVTVACLPALSTSLMPLAVKSLQSNSRSFRMFVDTGVVPELIEKLQAFSVDLALSLAIPPIVGIEAEPLFEVDHVCAVPRGHRLAHKDVVTPQDFEGEKVVGWGSTGPLSFKEEEKVFQDYVTPDTVVVATHTSHTRYAMVAAGIGITIGEPFAAESWLDNGVVLRPFRPKLPLSYSLLYPTGRLRADPVNIVRKSILSAVRQWREDHGRQLTLRPAVSGD